MVAELQISRKPVVTVYRRSTAERRIAASLAAPACFLLLLLVIGPVLAVFWLSVTDWQLGARSLSYVGLQNYRNMLDDPVFRASIINTTIYVLVVVPATTVLGLFTAILIERSGALRPVYRALHFLPVMATLSAMAIAWEAMLHPTIGLVNNTLALVGLPRPNWLASPDLVVATLCVIGVWQHIGYAMVLFIAGLKAIPEELYQAAEIDGVSTALDRLMTVTLPMLGPVTMFVVIIVALKAFEVFDTVRVLTQGGPGSASEMLLHTLFVESFEYFRTGYGASLTVVFLVVVMVLTLGQARVLDKRIHYS